MAARTSTRRPRDARATMARTATTRRTKHVEHIGGDALEEVPRRAHRPAPPVQDPGGDQAPPGAARPGRQGGARQQGRGAHHLSLARRPLFRADAQHRARWRHLPQDHRRRGPPAPEVDRPGTRGAGRHGRHPAHRRRRAHQARSQARLRIPDAHVGDGARDDAWLVRADAGLRGRIADQARHPRPLQQGRRRGRRRRRGRLSRGEGVHAPSDAVARQERAALARPAADVHQGMAPRHSSMRCSRRR